MQLFDRRAKYVKTHKEQKKWNDLTVQYISEETSGEDDVSTIIRKAIAFLCRVEMA